MISTGDTISSTLCSTGYWAKLSVDISAMFRASIDAPFIRDIRANPGAFAIPLARNIAPLKGTVSAYETQRIVLSRSTADYHRDWPDSIGDVSPPAAGGSTAHGVEITS